MDGYSTNSLQRTQQSLERPQTPSIAKIQVVQVSSLLYTYTWMRGVGTHSESQEDAKWVQLQMPQQNNQQAI